MGAVGGKLKDFPRQMLPLPPLFSDVGLRQFSLAPGVAGREGPQAGGRRPGFLAWFCPITQEAEAAHCP